MQRPTDDEAYYSVSRPGRLQLKERRLHKCMMIQHPVSSSPACDASTKVRRRPRVCRSLPFPGRPSIRGFDDLSSRSMPAKKEEAEARL
jgi:hypothetical protein